jgi:hypothetical protein
VIPPPPVTPPRRRQQRLDHRPRNEAGNVRNGSRPKTVLTEGTGQVGIEVPRDRDGTFEPQIVRKRQRRLNGVDEIVPSLYAKGLTAPAIRGHRGHNREYRTAGRRRYARYAHLAGSLHAAGMIQP